MTGRIPTSLLISLINPNPDNLPGGPERDIQRNGESSSTRGINIRRQPAKKRRYTRKSPAACHDQATVPMLNNSLVQIMSQGAKNVLSMHPLGERLMPRNPLRR
jgi:hypothetical protein